MNIRNFTDANRLYDIRDRIDNIRQRLSSIWECPAERPAAESDLEEIEILIEGLPLPTLEFDLAINRLKNARRYLRSSEFGAAKYELMLLMGSF